MNVLALFALLFVAAVLGDSVNYWIGMKAGPPVFERDSRFLKKKHLVRTQEFYERHGGKTIFLARFVPIVRTFAPFVAGVGAMNYRRFVVYNIAGALCWVGIFLFAGYFFGNIPVVQDNFGIVILAIIVISVLPMLYELRPKRGVVQAAPDST
jgi:membrane-associated protein